MPRGDRDDSADDDNELVGPTPKKRALAPREAALNAKARMAGHSGKSSSLDDSAEQIPETQGGGGAGNTSGQFVSPIAPGAMHNTSLPCNIQNVHLNPG